MSNDGVLLKGLSCIGALVNCMHNFIMLTSLPILGREQTCSYLLAKPEGGAGDQIEKRAYPRQIESGGVLRKTGWERG